MKGILKRIWNRITRKKDVPQQVYVDGYEEWKSMRRKELGLSEKSLTLEEIASNCFFIPVFKFSKKQPERLNPKTSKGDLIVRTSVISGRDEPEAVCPPGDRS